MSEPTTIGPSTESRVIRPPTLNRDERVDAYLVFIKLMRSSVPLEEDPGRNTALVKLEEKMFGIAMGAAPGSKEDRIHRRVAELLSQRRSDFDRMTYDVHQSIGTDTLRTDWYPQPFEPSHCPAGHAAYMVVITRDGLAVDWSVEPVGELGEPIGWKDESGTGMWAHCPSTKCDWFLVDPACVVCRYHRPGLPPGCSICQPGREEG